MQTRIRRLLNPPYQKVIGFWDFAYIRSSAPGGFAPVFTVPAMSPRNKYTTKNEEKSSGRRLIHVRGAVCVRQ